jgi:hypothetical protein
MSDTLQICEVNTKLYSENLEGRVILGDLGVSGRMVYLFQRTRMRGWRPDSSGLA